MKKEEIRKKVQEIYTFLYKEGVSNSFRFPNGYAAKSVDSFVEDIYKRENGLISVGFLVDYCIHQTYYWRDINRWKNFKVSWSFSKKAIDKYYSTKGGARYYQDLWLQENKLSREGIKSKFTAIGDHPLRKFIYIQSEDYTKHKEINTLKGYGLCLSLTTLYSPLSPVCQKCKYAKDCEEVLLKRNCELHRLRVNT